MSAATKNETPMPGRAEGLLNNSKSQVDFTQLPTQVNKAIQDVIKSTRASGGLVSQAVHLVDIDRLSDELKRAEPGVASLRGFDRAGIYLVAFLEELARATVWLSVCTTFRPRINRRVTVTDMARWAAVATGGPVSPFAMAVACGIRDVWTRDKAVTPISCCGVNVKRTEFQSLTVIPHSTARTESEVRNG